MTDANFAPIVIGSITGLFLIACLKLWIEHSNLKEEHRLLSQWRARVRTLDIGELEVEFRKLVSESQKPSQRGYLQKAFLGDDSQERLTLQAIRAVWLGRNTGVDLEAVSSMLAQRESGRLGFPFAAPNLCMLLGLIGTVLGLALTIPELAIQVRQAATSADPKQLGASLGATLANMQSAFYATLAGITSSLLLGFFARHVSHEQSHFLADVQDFTISEFGPRVLPQQNEATIEDLAKAVRSIQGVIKSVPEIMSQAASDFSTALDSTGTQMTSTLEGLRLVSTEIQKSLVAAASDVRGSAQSLGTATVAVAEASTGLKEYHRDLTVSHQRILELFEQSRQELQSQISSQLGSITEFRDQVMRSTAEIVGKISTMTEAFQEAAREHHRSTDDAASRVVEYRESVVFGFTELQKQVKDVFEQHESGLQRVSSELRNLAGKFDPVVMDQQWKGLQTSIDNFERGITSLSTSLRDFKVDELVSATQRLPRQVSPTDENPARSRSQPEQVDAQSNTELRIAISELRESARVLAGAAQLMAQASQQRSYPTRESVGSPPIPTSSNQTSASREGFFARLFRRRGRDGR